MSGTGKEINEKKKIVRKYNGTERPSCVDCVCMFNSNIYIYFLYILYKNNKYVMM